MAELLGDAFKFKNIPVYYSIDENDDTIAAKAWYDNAEVLSKNKDFWRYRPFLKSILNSFTINQGWI